MEEKIYSCLEDIEIHFLHILYIKGENGFPTLKKGSDCEYERIVIESKEVKNPSWDLIEDYIKQIFDSNKPEDKYIHEISLRLFINPRIEYDCDGDPVTLSDTYLDYEYSFNFKRWRLYVEDKYGKFIKYNRKNNEVKPLFLGDITLVKTVIKKFFEGENIDESVWAQDWLETM